MATSDSRKFLRQSTSRGTGNAASPSYAPNLLNGKIFLLEIDNRQNRDKMTTAIGKLKGTIVHTFEDPLPQAVISDHPLAIRIKEKSMDQKKLSAAFIKAMPTLLREAVKRQIQITTVDHFLKRLSEASQKSRSTTGVSNSNSAKKATTLPTPANPQLKTILEKPVETTPVTRPKQPDQKESTTKKAFIRIDAPGKRPDTRILDEECCSLIYFGEDAGHSIFKQGDDAINNRRITDYANFQRGKYVAAPKASYKIEENDSYCQFCNITVDKMEDHVKTDQHRHKVRNVGKLPELERVVMTTKLQLQNEERCRKRQMARQAEKNRYTPEELTQKLTDYEYGENSTVINWSRFKKRGRSLARVASIKEEKENEKVKAEAQDEFPTDPIELDLLSFTGHYKS